MLTSSVTGMSTAVARYWECHMHAGSRLCAHSQRVINANPRTASKPRQPPSTHTVNVRLCVSRTPNSQCGWSPFAFREAVLFDPTTLHCPIACKHRGPLVSIYTHTVLSSYSCTYVCSLLGPLTFREPDLAIAKASSSSLKLIGLCWADVAP